MSHHDAPHAADPTGGPWPSVALAFAIAAAVAGLLAWREQQDLGAVHGATRFVPVDATLATAGRLLPGAPEQLKAAGFEVVIDLRGPDEPGQPEERAAVEAAGLRYVGSPVAGTPKVEDFVAFSQALAAERPRKVLVHCASNKRASTMVMLHRATREGVPAGEARRAMDAAWQPRKAWADFVDGVLAAPPPVPTT